MTKDLMPKISNNELVSFLLILVYGLVFMLIPNITTKYPIGHDAQAYLGNLKVMNEINFHTSLVYVTPLLHFILSILSFCFNMVSFLKLFSIFMYGTLGLTIYYYARRGLKWEASKSILTSILLLSSPITLFTGWTLYSQLFSTCLFFILLTQLKLFLDKKHSTLIAALKNKQFVLILILIVLIGWSHLIVSALLLFICCVEFIISLIKKQRESVIFLLCGLMLILSYVIFKIILVPEPFRDINPQNLQLIFARPTKYDGGSTWLLSLFLLSYMFLIPVSLFGFFKDSQVLLMFAFPTIFFSLYAVAPSLALIPPDRTIYLYQYPLTLLVSNAIYRIKENKKILIKFKATTPSVSIKLRNVVATCILCLLVFQSLNTTGLFKPISFFGHPPSGYPTSAQWSGVSISEIDVVINMTQWYNRYADSSSLLIVPEGAFGWVKYHLGRELFVVMWHPVTVLSPLVLEGQLIVIRVRSVEDIINEPIVLRYFDKFYLMDIPSWRNVGGGFSSVDFRLTKITSIRDVVLYQIMKF